MLNNNIVVKSPHSFILPRYGHLYIKDQLKKFSELMVKTEYESVKRGFRLADRYHLTSQNYDKEIEKVVKDGLVFLPIYRIKQYNGFSHTHTYIEELNNDSMVYGVIAKDLDVAKDFVDAHKKGSTDHKSIGEMLGYPECCRTAFNEFWKKSYDPIQEIAKNTDGNKNCGHATIIENGNPNLFVHLRYFGLRVIPYFPCSFKCEESTEFAEKWLKIMKDLDEDNTNKLLEMLNTHSKWDLYNAQVICSHSLFLGRSTSYYDENKKVVVFR